MNQGTDQFDDSTPPARRMAVPRLAPGPHRQELRRALMREARELSERRAAGGGRALPLWLGPLAYAVSAVVLLAAGLLWIAYQQRGALFAERPGASPTARRTATTTTNQAAGRGLGAALGIGGGSVGDGRTAARIRDAIEKSQVQLDQVLPTTTGARTYVYRTTSGGGGSGDGDAINFASPRILATKALTTPVYEQEFEQAISMGRGRVLSQGVSELGSRVYRYRVGLSNGLSETYGSEREPDDAGIRERHKNELNAAMIDGSGEVAQTLAGADGNPAVVLVKVTLNDGTIKTYAGPAKPGGM